MEEINFSLQESLNNNIKDRTELDTYRNNNLEMNIFSNNQILFPENFDGQKKYLNPTHSKSGFSVAVRFRPSNFQETNSEDIKIWEISDNFVYDHPRKTRYYFDHVFTEKSTNQMIFNKIVKDVLKSCLKGVNVTIFAYGQTSSGKTHTMFGDNKGSYDGIIPLSVNEIFLLANSSNQSEDQNSKFLINVSYLEVYNEKLIDLLASQNNPRKIKIVDGIDGAVEFINLTSKHVSSPEEIHEIIRIGSKIRRIAETSMNERSSRSHTILRIKIETHFTNSTDVCVGILNFVDLAGSESIKRTQLEGDRRKEGMSINRSLLALSQVISQLSENSNSDVYGNQQNLNFENTVLSKNKYINYRDSKITRILSDSLGGNSKTIIVCNCSPDKINYYETLSTLDFAKRAKNIQNKIKVNVLKPKDKSAQILKLENKILILQEKLKNISSLGNLEHENEILRKKQVELNLEINELRSQLNINQKENLSIALNLTDTNLKCDNCLFFKEKYFEFLKKYAQIIDSKDAEIKSLNKEINLTYLKLTELMDIKDENNRIKSELELKKAQIVNQNVEIENLSKIIKKLQTVEIDLILKKQLIENLTLRNNEKDQYCNQLKLDLNKSNNEIEKFVKWYIYNVSNHKNFYNEQEFSTYIQEKVCDDEFQIIFAKVKNYFYLNCDKMSLQETYSISNPMIYKELSDELLDLQFQINIYELEKQKIDFETINLQLNAFNKMNFIINNLFEIIKLLLKSSSCESITVNEDLLKTLSVSESYIILRKLKEYQKEIEELQFELDSKKKVEIECKKLKLLVENLEMENKKFLEIINIKSKENRELLLSIEELRYRLEQGSKLKVSNNKHENETKKYKILNRDNKSEDSILTQECREFNNNQILEFNSDSGNFQVFKNISNCKTQLESENENTDLDKQNINEINNVQNDEDFSKGCKMQ